MTREEEKTIAYPPGWGGPDQVAPTQPDYGGAPSPIAPTIRAGGAPAGGGFHGESAGLQKTVVIGREEGPALMAWLVITHGPYRGRLFHLSGEAVTLGRDYGCDIPLDDDTVSRQHAKVKIVTEEGRVEFYLHDMASTAGTHVNGEEVSKHKLQDGDEIVVGRTHLVFKRV